MNAPPRRKRLEKRELSMPRTLEPYQMIERSIIKKYRDELWKPFVYAVKKYELIQAGDKIAVCISGGKDSMLMAKLMQELHRHSDVPFELVFLVMDPGYNAINRTDDNPCILYEEGTTSVSPNFEVTTLSLGVDMLAAALCHMSHAIVNRLYKIVDPGFTGLNRFLTPHEVKTIAFSTMQKTFAALDAENRWLANTTTLDITSFANGIEDHASNLPLAGMRSLRIVDNLRYMLGMELMHAAQAVEMRRDQRADNLLKLGKVTGPLKDAYRKTIPYYDADRNLSIDIEKSYQVIKNGSLLKVIEEAERA